MHKIEISNLYLNYPIYSNVSRSLKKHVMNRVVGADIGHNNGVYFVEALKNINLSIKDGDRLGLYGQNGSGKTTLLRVLAGLLTPTHGDVNICGSVNSFIDIHFGMNLEATGYENIKMRSVINGIPLKRINSIIEDIINFSELGNYIHLPVKTYSSGMIMRLSFSIMASIKKDIIIMDEWLSVGDDIFKKKANSKLDELISNSSIFVLASHDQNLINTMCNKQLHLEHGKIVS